ncbi:MAG: hypothetical protein WEB30_00945 [Cyclobacteriaceae bacterium]
MTLWQYVRDFKEQGYWRAFKEWTIGFTIMLFILALISGGSIISSLTIAFLMALITAMVTLPLGYWYQQHKLKRIKGDRLNSPTFKFLTDLGFIKQETFLEGIYKGYYMRTCWTEGNPFGQDGKMTYSVRLLFLFTGDFRPTNEFKENYKATEQIIWHDDCV